MKRKVFSGLFLVLFVLLAIHFVWCVVVHKDVTKAADTTTAITDESGKVLTFEEILEENQALRDENSALKTEKEALISENSELKAHMEDKEECHGLCAVHCPCLHKEIKVEETDWTLEKVKKASMCCKQSRVVKTVCADCGEVLETKTEIIEDTEHSYGDNGACTDCGYKPSTSKPSTPTTPSTPSQPSTPSTPSQPSTPNEPVLTVCKHTNTEKQVTDWAYVAIGEPAICQKATRLVKTVCVSCKEVLSEEPEVTFDTDHDFDDDVCEDCGYTMACSHAKTKKEKGDWSDWKKVSEKETCRYRTRTIWHVCTKCDEVVSSEPEVDYDESHSFEGRTCTDCGYKKPLETGYGEAEGEVPPPTNSWTYEDDGELPTPVD